MAHGTKETKVYSARNGAVYRQDLLSGTQYHARTMSKGRPVGRYYGTKAGAIAWLNRINPPKE